MYLLQTWTQHSKCHHLLFFQRNLSSHRIEYRSTYPRYYLRCILPTLPFTLACHNKGLKVRTQSRKGGDLPFVLLYPPTRLGYILSSKAKPIQFLGPVVIPFSGRMEIAFFLDGGGRLLIWDSGETPFLCRRAVLVFKSLGFDSGSWLWKERRKSF